MLCFNLGFNDCFMKNSCKYWLMLVILVVTYGCNPKNVESFDSSLNISEGTQKNLNNSDSIANQNGLKVKIVPTMSTEIQEGDIVHCSNFEILWNKITQGKRINTNNKLINELNTSKTWLNSLDTNNVIISFGHPDSVYLDIKKQFRSKYNIENNSIPKKGNTFWGYSFKQIDYSYKEPFPKISLLFQNTKVNAFGFYAGRASKVEKDHFYSFFEILYYNNDNDFIIKLNPENSEDDIVLVMSEKKPTFKLMYNKATRLIATGKEERKEQPSKYTLGEADELRIPIIRFNVTNQFSELNGIKFSEKYAPIEIMEQSINFNFDEKGVQMESEMVISDSASLSSIPKLLHYNKPFYLYIKEKQAPFPYFNLWVNSSNIMEPYSLNMEKK